jgi:hypothetical protein
MGVNASTLAQYLVLDQLMINYRLINVVPAGVRDGIAVRR